MTDWLLLLALAVFGALTIGAVVAAFRSIQGGRESKDPRAGLKRD